MADEWNALGPKGRAKIFKASESGRGGRSGGRGRNVNAATSWYRNDQGQPVPGNDRESGDDDTAANKKPDIETSARGANAKGGKAGNGFGRGMYGKN